MQTCPEALLGVLCGWTWASTLGSLAFGSWGQSGARPTGASVLSALPERQGRVDIMRRATQRCSFSPSTAGESHLTSRDPSDAEMTPQHDKNGTQRQESAQTTACSTSSVSPERKGRAVLSGTQGAVSSWARPGEVGVGGDAAVDST